MDPFVKFNATADEFLRKMIISFPKEKKISEYKLMFDGIKFVDHKKPVFLFMSSLEPYGLQVMSKDENFFKKDQFVENAESMSGQLGLTEYWDSMHPETKKSIWSYTQTLYILGMKATGHEKEFQDIIKSVNGPK
jgi:hypothetical protein